MSSTLISAVRGNTIKLTGTVTLAGIAVNLTTVTSLTFTLKNAYTQANPGLCQKTIGSGIAVSGTDHNVFTVTIAPLDTSTQTAPATYYWDIKLVESDTTVTTISSGTLSLLPNVT